MLLATVLAAHTFLWNMIVSFSRLSPQCHYHRELHYHGYHLVRQKYHWDWLPLITEGHHGSQCPGHNLQARHWTRRFTAITEPVLLQLQVYTYRHKQDPPWARTPAIKVLEQVTFTLSLQGHVWTDKVYMVRDLKLNLLVLPTIEELNLLAKVINVRQEADDKVTLPLSFLS